MAVNQRLRALLDMADVDIISSYPQSFPADITARARIRSFIAARWAIPTTVKIPLFSVQVAIWAVSIRLVRRRYEVVYTFQDVSAIAAWILGPCAGRWAMDVLDDPRQSLGNASQRRQRLKSGLLHLYERAIGFLLRRPDIVFTIGLVHEDPLPKALAEHYHVALDRIYPLRQSVDVRKVRNIARPTAAGPEPQAAQVSFIGYVSKLRGVDTLIAAGLILQNRGVNIELVLMGHLKKKDEEWLRAAQDSLPGLRYEGVLPSPEALQRMSRVTLGVLPFPDRPETAPVQAVTGIEYLALGKPIVATDLPGARALVDQHINGILVPPADAEAMADAIEEIVASPALAKDMSEASLKKAEAFDAALIRKEVIRVLRGC